MDLLKDRVGGFTECTFVMACPVLLAVATKKVNISSEGNYPAVGHGIPPLAAISLVLCPVAFLVLWIGSWLRSRWGLKDFVNNLDNKPAPPLTKLWILGVTKSLVHVSAILQMLLAYMIFLFITIKLGVASLVWLVLWCVVVIAWGCYEVQGIISKKRLENWEGEREGGGRADGGRQEQQEAEQERRRQEQQEAEQERRRQEHWWNKALEMLLDLSAAVASSLFLGLEVMALEGQTKVGEDLDPGLHVPVTATFCCCVFASAVMLVATVPPIYRSGQQENHGNNNGLVRNLFIHVLCGLVAVCLAVVVIFFIVFRVLNSHRKEAKILGTVVGGATILPMFLCYVIGFCCHTGDQDADGELKPASLEMTKVTFTAFLAISSPSFGGGADLSTCTRAFLVTAALYVIFGVGWRFFSHFKQNAAIWTSKAACVCTHLCLAVAALELVYMATRTDDTCFPTQNTCSATQNTTAT